MTTVSVYTSHGKNNDDPFSEVYINPISAITIYRFNGEDHQRKAESMASELNAIIQKYREMEEE